MIDLISLNNNKPITTSIKVAKFFNKRHKNVLRDINNLLKSYPNYKNTVGLNFELCFKNNDLQNGKPQPYYILNKDGFTLLAFGFTGKKAMEFKITYIQAFNAMEQQQSVYQQYLTKQQEFNNGFSKASIAGRTLGLWAKAKRYLNYDLAYLENKIQPSLPFYKEL